MGCGASTGKGGKKKAKAEDTRITAWPSDDCPAEEQPRRRNKRARAVHPNDPPGYSKFVRSRRVSRSSDKDLAGNGMRIKHRAAQNHVCESTTQIDLDTRLNQYRIVRKQPIGEGWQSKVYLVEDVKKKGKPRFAMKVMKMGKIEKIGRKATDTQLFTDGANGDVWIEVTVAKMLGHPNVTKLVEVIKDEENINLVFALEKGVLATKSSGKIFPAAEARRHITGILCGVDFMHSQGIVHRDIKLENVLISKDGEVKISDFGMAHIIQADEGQPMDDTLVKGIGSRKYRAPELFQDTPHSGFAADTWAVGVILFCIVCGKLPFDGNGKKEQAYNIQHKQLPMPRQCAKDPLLQDLISKLLHKNPRKRITIPEALNHGWISGGAGGAKSE
jgi:serine/threonine protein kinase